MKNLLLSVILCSSISYMHASDTSSGILSKLKEVQWKDQNGGMLALGATALTCFGAWQFNHWQYGYRYRNGDMEHRREKMFHLLPVLSNKLTQLYSEKRSSQENAAMFEPNSFTVRQSLLDAPALHVTVAPSQKVPEDDEEYAAGVTITIANLLHPGQTTIVKSQFDTFASDRLDELREVGRALSSGESVNVGFARLLASGISSTCWLYESHGLRGRAALGLDSAAYAAEVAICLGDTGIIERLRNGQPVLSDHRLIKLEQTCTSDGKQATLCLTDLVSGKPINFVIQNASIFNAIRRLELGWSRAPYAQMADSIHDVMLAYAISKDALYYNNVRFSIADKINTASQKPATQWILLSQDERSEGKLVCPMAPPVQMDLLTADVLDHALTTFLTSDIMRRKKLHGKRKYIVDINVPWTTPEPGTEQEPIQLVSLRIAQEKNDLDKCVITIDSNNLRTNYKITMGEEFSPAAQLADETLRSKLIATIADAHIQYTQFFNTGGLQQLECTMPDNGNFELRLGGSDGRLCYCIYNEQGELLWHTEFFSLASSSAGPLVQEDEDMPHGAGWAHCGGMLLSTDAYVYRSDDDTETEDTETDDEGWATCGMFEDNNDN